MDKVQVQIVGLSEAKIAEDTYWLLFKEVNGDRHAPILIGKAEAQSITVSLRGVQLPVKLTHQLFGEITRQYGIRLQEVCITSDDEQLFTAQLLWDNGYDAYSTESRASDGVALALCCGTPIFMSTEIFDKIGRVITKNASEVASELTDDDLQTLLTQAVADEDYEQAAKLRDEIKKRVKSKDGFSNK